MKKFAPNLNSSRPISWCVDGYEANNSDSVQNLCKEKEEEEEHSCNDILNRNLMDKRESLLRGVLVRSSSYQALHSALARLYRLDDFTLEKIGQGFFSEVYRARHLVTGKVMVLKMNKLFSNRHNMLREVELMNRLHHPNILTYYGVCVNEGQVHALTEYINGGSLNTLLQNLHIDLPWVIRASLSLDIARGMAYLHSKKVFHRDLTSRNILIKQSKDTGKVSLRAVIADFGLAAPIPQDRSVRLRQVGSPYWMAPEVIRGEWYDHRADCFSFGIIVCEIIARCDADPDVLPRTHNFGIHYLAFSRMCQNDCSPRLLEMAFQCCQISPASRPSFKELETLLFCLLTDSRPVSHSPRKQKAYHKRSLSDESRSIARSKSSDLPSKCVSHPTAGSPQEVIDRISAADPYFQPSTATVNPFSSVKLPAKSQLILQDGGRYCHSMPADLSNNPYVRQSEFTISSFTHLTTSDNYLSHGASHIPNHPCPDCNHVSSSAKIPSVPCYESHSCRKTDCKYGVCKCSSVEPVRRLPPSTLSNRLHPAVGYNSETSNSTYMLSPRSDVFGGGHALTNHSGMPVRRRGSGESGFFSVEDELCLSYSELSSASFLSIDDEDPYWMGLRSARCRSPSVLTNSSEDLSSLSCGHDLNCDLVSASECESPGRRFFGSTEGTAKDIKSIVEFFERGYGSLRTTGDMDRGGPLPTSGRRRDCLVPLLKSRFSNSPASYRALVGSQPHCSGGTSVPRSVQGSISKCICTKDKCRLSCSGRRPAKERPKIYITEGTVRAKRNIFESK